MQETIAIEIETYLGQHGNGITPSREDNLFMVGALDSVGIMKLIAHLESHYTIRIPPADLTPDNFRSVDAMAVYLSQLVELPA